jgi:sphingolipid C9-methyltransferase
MNDAASSALGLEDAANANDRKRPASEHTETGRTHWLSVIFWLLEKRWPVLLMIPTTIAGAVTLLAGGGAATFVLAWLTVPLGGIGIPLLLIVERSRRHDGGPAEWEPFISFRDAADAARWAGRKIPMEIVYEAYLAGKLDFRGDVYDVMLRRNRIFRFCFTWGDLKFYVSKFLRQKLGHSLKADRDDVAPNYDRGNDFYRWFLGDSMVYTSGLFADPSETLEVAQARKLETVCRYVQMRPGDRHLDIGCGWGGLLAHAAREYGTHSTGVTLSKEQASWASEIARVEGLGDRVRILVDDYRNLPSERFDKITCLEMAEHVGIRNFQKFLLQVRHMLEDDGIFYLQIAGLRRPWQYEDLVWGLFMGKYIFPGADASCPLAFVVSQAERAGFEVHRVENCGAHYSVTIQKWYENWKRNQAEIVATYGERWYRLWLLFLGWSALIAAQGSSALFLMTMTKNHKNDKSSVSAEEAENLAFSRQKRWIGRSPVATQQ